MVKEITNVSETVFMGNVGGVEYQIAPKETVIAGVQVPIHAFDLWQKYKDNGENPKGIRGQLTFKVDLNAQSPIPTVNKVVKDTNFLIKNKTDKDFCALLGGREYKIKAGESVRVGRDIPFDAWVVWKKYPNSLEFVELKEKHKKSEEKKVETV